MLPGGADDLDDYQTKSSSNTQNNSIVGVHKGIVVGNQDPFQLGKVLVFCYGLHGDYKNFNLDSLYWADVVMPFKGAFNSPKLWDRVWVMFEANDRKSPVVIGYWYGAPTGQGQLAHNSGVGSEVPPEAWLQHDLVQESLVLARSGNGNALWFEDKCIDKSIISSLVAAEDTGGKYWFIRSYHQNGTDYDANSQVPEKLDGASVPPRVAIRDGISPVTDPVSGEITFGHQNISRSLKTSADDFVLDSLIVSDTNGPATTIDASNAMIQSRQGKSAILQASDAIFFNTQAGIFSPLLFSLPRRWDK